MERTLTQTFHPFPLPPTHPPTHTHTLDTHLELRSKLYNRDWLKAVDVSPDGCSIFAARCRCF
jgi:hypothetical protein